MDFTRDSLLHLIQTGLKRDALSIAGLEKQAGVPKDTVRDFLRAKTQVLRADKLQKVLRVLEPEPGVPVSCYVGADAEIFALPKESAPFQIVPCPPGFAPSEIIAARVQGDAMMPVFHDGWIVYYQRGSAPVPALEGGWQVPYHTPKPAASADEYAEFLGKPAITHLKDGRTMLRTVKRGTKPKRYNLVSYNAGTIENAQLESLSKIIFIKT